ncbi:DUF4489 domain-containing protein [Wukongibacter baidiensis]|uniref:DUF4489 domain-containing protein n=1 Tax=Wukongibacter baidiensis TaxID=1723361 RepID=UPI003D7FAE40
MTYKVCKPDSESIKCKTKYKKAKKILLECGEGTGSRTFTSFNDAPFQLANVIIDKTCLNRSEMLIKFSSLVRVERLDDGATARLQYELSRICEDGALASLGIWRFEKINIALREFSRVAEESFNFIFCDSNACKGCCEYLVTIMPLEITNARATISNGKMATLNQSLDYRREMYDSKSDPANLAQNCPKEKEIILESGQETGSITFVRGNELPVQIADVTIDASCLCKSEVLVEFSSIVSYASAFSPASTIQLQFELFRICAKGEPVSRGIWTFEVDSVEGVLSSKSFSFISCDLATFSGCCEYFVIVTPIEVFEGTQGFGESITISDSRVSAVVQSDGVGDKKTDILDDNRKNPKPKWLLLECGQGTGSSTFTTSNNEGFQLTQLTIDIKGLCKPKVNIEFSSIVSLEPGFTGYDALLRYELLRICDDGMLESRGIWTFRRGNGDDAPATTTTESFDFTFCETIKCKSDCCTYIVKVTPIGIIGSQVTVSNGRMAALVQGGY